MPVELIDTAELVLDIHRDLSITTRARKPGPPERIDGMTIGVVTMTTKDRSSHNGEMHPDGDEILYVISGKLRISYDASNVPMVLGTGQACIVHKDEWHKIDCLEDACFMHITPGPNAEARFE